MGDIKCFVTFFVVAISFSIVNLKSRLFWSIYSTSTGMGLQALTLFPPVFLSVVYCVFVSAVECCLARASRPHARSARSLGGTVCDADSEERPSGERAHHEGRQTSSSCCATRV